MDYFSAACGAEIRDKRSDCRMCSIKGHTKTKTGVTAIWALLDWGPIQAGVILKKVILRLRKGKLSNDVV